LLQPLLGLVQGQAVPEWMRRSRGMSAAVVVRFR